MEVKENKKQPKKPLIFYYVLALVVVMLLNVFLFPSLLNNQVTEITYDKFLDMLDAGEITEVALDETTGQIV